MKGRRQTCYAIAMCLLILDKRVGRATSYEAHSIFRRCQLGLSGNHARASGRALLGEKFVACRRTGLVHDTYATVQRCRGGGLGRHHLLAQDGSVGHRAEEEVEVDQLGGEHPNCQRQEPTQCQQEQQQQQQQQQAWQQENRPQTHKPHMQRTGSKTTNSRPR